MNIENISMLCRCICYTYIDAGSTPAISTDIQKPSIKDGFCVSGLIRSKLIVWLASGVEKVLYIFQN